MAGDYLQARTAARRFYVAHIEIREEHGQKSRYWIRSCLIGSKRSRAIFFIYFMRAELIWCKPWWGKLTTRNTWALYLISLIMLYLELTCGKHNKIKLNSLVLMSAVTFPVIVSPGIVLDWLLIIPEIYMQKFRKDHPRYTERWFSFRSLQNYLR